MGVGRSDKRMAVLTRQFAAGRAGYRIAMGNRRLIMNLSWIVLSAISAVSIAVHSDLALLIIWVMWLTSGLICIAVSPGHRLRAGLLVVLSGVIAFRGFAVLLVFLSCAMGHECGI